MKNKHYLKGKKVDVIVKAAKTFFNERLSPLISPKALEEIRCLKEKGYMIILLSGTLIPFVDCFIDYCKADIVKKLAKEYNIDLSNSYSYANQYIDVKFMRLTGFPVAVNARKNNWCIATF